MILPTDEEEVDGSVGEALDDWQSRMDDRRWSWHAFRAPFTWQRFVDWWVARRWVIPRDHTRR